MDRLNIQECEKDFVEASVDLDNAEFTFSQNWIIERASANSDKQADHATILVGFKINELKAKRDIARIRLEAAYAGKKD